MKRLRRIMLDCQVITELDKEEMAAKYMQVWSRMGYRPHGPMQVCTATIRQSNGSMVDTIIYTQVMVRWAWRWV